MPIVPRYQQQVSPSVSSPSLVNPDKLVSSDMSSFDYADKAAQGLTKSAFEAGEKVTRVLAEVVDEADKVEAQEQAATFQSAGNKLVANYMQTEGKRAVADRDTVSEQIVKDRAALLESLPRNQARYFNQYTLPTLKAYDASMTSHAASESAKHEDQVFKSKIQAETGTMVVAHPMERDDFFEKGKPRISALVADRAKSLGITKESEPERYMSEVYKAFTPYVFGKVRLTLDTPVSEDGKIGGLGNAIAELEVNKALVDPEKYTEMHQRLTHARDSGKTESQANELALKFRAEAKGNYEAATNAVFSSDLPADTKRAVVSSLQSFSSGEAQAAETTRKLQVHRLLPRYTKLVHEYPNWESVPQSEKAFLATQPMEVQDGVKKMFASVGESKPIALREMLYYTTEDLIGLSNLSFNEAVAIASGLDVADKKKFMSAYEKYSKNPPFVGTQAENLVAKHVKNWAEEEALRQGSSTKKASAISKGLTNKVITALHQWKQDNPKENITEAQIKTLVRHAAKNTRFTIFGRSPFGYNANLEADLTKEVGKAKKDGASK